MAIPKPASDSIEIDFTIIAGISKFHLQFEELIKTDFFLKKKKTKKKKW